MRLSKSSHRSIVRTDTQSHARLGLVPCYDSLLYPDGDWLLRQWDAPLRSRRNGDASGLLTALDKLIARRITRTQPPVRIESYIGECSSPCTTMRCCRYTRQPAVATTLVLRISAPMLSAIRDADALIESRWRCAYRAVVCTCV